MVPGVPIRRDTVPIVPIVPVAGSDRSKVQPFKRSIKHRRHYLRRFTTSQLYEPDRLEIVELENFSGRFLVPLSALRLGILEQLAIFLNPSMARSAGTIATIGTVFFKI